MPDRSQRNPALKARLVSEAARLFVEHALPDYHTAKRKAVQVLQANPRGLSLPSDEEVEEAVLAYQRLFRSDDQGAVVDEMRAAALALMRRLRDFSPRLTGEVLAGVAGSHSEITLHLLSEPVEALQWFLMERRIRFQTEERRIALAGGQVERLPVYELEFKGWPVALVSFTERQWRQGPVKGTGGGKERPLDRATLQQVERLLDEARLPDVAG